MIDNGIEKIITIRYDSLDTLFDREESMMKTLKNYLSRDEQYEYVESFITSDRDKYTLNLKIRLRDEYNS